MGLRIPILCRVSVPHPLGCPLPQGHEISSLKWPGLSWCTGQSGPVTGVNRMAGCPVGIGVAVVRGPRPSLLHQVPAQGPVSSKYICHWVSRDLPKTLYLGQWLVLPLGYFLPCFLWLWSVSFWNPQVPWPVSLLGSPGSLSHVVPLSMGCPLVSARVLTLLPSGHGVSTAPRLKLVMCILLPWWSA